MGAGAVPVLAAVAATLLVAPIANQPAAEAPRVAHVQASHRITGKLDKAGYTVIAVAANGKATTAYAKRGRFTLQPPAKRVTLHLRAPDGRYAGPVVLRSARHDKRVIVGVRQGVSLGRITVRSKRGYARVATSPRRAAVVATWWARAKRGVPVGAGNFGHVRSRTASTARGRDSDLDGVADLLDIDDDGDLILDKFDRVSTASLAQVTDEFLFQTNLTEYLDQTVNAGAGTLTPGAIDTGLQSRGMFQMNILPGDARELDCGQPHTGLSYCTTGGTGRLLEPGVAQQRRFPDEFDPDGDGMGSMVPGTQGPAPGSGNLVMTLVHGARSDQIGTGDLLIQRVQRGGVDLQFPAVVQYVYATTPAVASYDDGQGHAGAIVYPVAPNGPGTRGNPLQVGADVSGDVKVKFTVWRPQRTAIAPEPGEWTDIGGLNYLVSGGETAATCPASAFTDLSGNLRPLTAEDVSPGNYSGVRDTGSDQSPPDPAYRLGFTLNLTECLRAAGLLFDVGDAHMFTISGQTPNGTDGASQGIAFERVG